MRPARTPLFLLVIALSCSPPSDLAPEPDHAAHAVELAASTIIVDGHVDLPYRLYRPGPTDSDHPPGENARPAEDVSKRTEKGDIDWPRAREGGLDAPFLSIYVPASLGDTEDATRTADELIDLVEGIAAASPDKFALATSESAVRANHAAGRISLLMGMENGSPIAGDLDRLRHFYARGVRYVTLVHSQSNHIADSSFDENRPWGGLSPFGREVVAEMNRLGMMIDISHLSDDAAHRVLDLSSAPVIASHSSVRALTPGFERNISDDLLKRVADNGGVVMINFGSMFLDPGVLERGKANWEHLRTWRSEQGLDPGDPRAVEYRRAYMREHHPGYAGLDDVVEHIEHVVRVAGIDHVGLGSDFDGVGDSLPEGLKDVSDYPNLIRALSERGYSDEEIDKICSGNIFRVMRAVEEIAAGRGSDS